MRIGALEGGGTKMVLAVCNENGEVLDRVSIPTETPEITMPKMIAYFKEQQVEALGIGFFGPVILNEQSPKYGCVGNTPKLAWKWYPVLDEFKKALQIPVGFDTDVNAAALGEATWGITKGLKNSIYIIGAEFLQGFTAQGRVGLSWYDAGARSFYARQPVRSLNDLQGKTIRVQDSQIVIDMIRLLGAVPETTAYSDVYSALETGQIDAAENNWPAYYSMEHYKVARYYMADEHSRVPEVQLASGRTWDALPEEYRQTLQACARASAQYERQLWAQEETAARKAALAGGCRELPLPEEEMQNFRQLVQPLYWKYCADYLPLVEEIQAE